MPEVMIPYVGHFEGERITFSPARLYAYVDCMPSDYADALNEAYRELVGQLTVLMPVKTAMASATPDDCMFVTAWDASTVSPEYPLIVMVDYLGKPAWCEAYHVRVRLSDVIEPRDIGFILNI